MADLVRTRPVFRRDKHMDDGWLPAGIYPSEVRDMREALGLSHHEIARLVGVSVFLWKTWEIAPTNRPSRIPRVVVDFLRLKRCMGYML